MRRWIIRFERVLARALAVMCVLSNAPLTNGAEVAGTDAPHLWTKGLATDEGYFPIAVWLQSPRNAARYKTAGIDLYVGLWSGPTAEQLADLEKAGMRVICAQNALALANKQNPVIAGWSTATSQIMRNRSDVGKVMGRRFRREKSFPITSAFVERIRRVLSC